ncbi:multicopper oxidase domain-containing protein [Mucilaginibacter rubeus]|uniref:Multicopper oxidase domain-containing protein n=2 Tax=Mucilaginibacter rubeus TaxID=2027860 RepID=A0A364WWD5_9SPHI|nr:MULTISPECIES: multicopper oxidase domain-containing protein [Mucilaginibacter]QEM06131.1 multicopper oxidase domain-containing protein [Mucilaginibacter rubeus]QEM13648.1 multicopper oxidase domain-containing protein [Mucilaginibacter rubeus]QEM18711.1 multicopper oxidase domain-containing protein [Mucilaginibacter gossypii]QTE40539.2 multicopper oxidase domain-containing protein [Mucilaginibacter gossypii]RAV60118.1 copper oxidase [Mucilaginibacter rubeus]
MKKILVIVVLLCLKQLAFAQGDMQNMAGMEKKQAVTYTCPMHPEIHASKPGNCPKCGMKLVKEKNKTVAKKDNGMQMPANPTTKKAGSMDGMKMGEENSNPNPEKSSGMSMKNDGQKTDNMEGMKMGDNDAASAEIKSARANLGPIKTIAAVSPPHTVRYDLYVRDTTVMLGKKPKRAIAVNGQIPMPTLTFTEGDTAEIWVHNELNEETSLHWHGLFLPNKMDGVPYITQMPIKPHTKYLYKFPIVQHGTHWYHSHSGLQEQIGMYGAFIMKKRQEWNIPSIPVVLSDWIDMNPKEVERSLHNQTDWFSILKGTTQSYAEAIRTGHLKTKLTNEWKRMTAMDVSDVAYDNFLINGKNQSTLSQFKAGDKVRLRIANGGASSYFWLNWAGGKITVVANDGNDVEPVEVDRLIIAVSETYDVVVTIPDNKSYEFLVTPEDRTKHASLWLGSGEKVAATKMPKLKYFAGMKMMNDMMDMKGNLVKMDGMDMKNQEMDMNTVMYPEISGPENPADTMKSKQDMRNSDMNKSPVPAKDSSKKMQPQGGAQSMAGMDMGNSNADIVTLSYAMLRAPEKTTLRSGPVKELKFNLTGNMNRYVWSIDNKVVSEADKILIKKGENVRIILYNNTMMRHPMHLHGHDFRVLNGQGEYAPLKNVLDIMPMESDTIEFAATEPGGDWFFHCHILYHMMSGMGRVFSYQDTLVDKTDITNPKLAQRRLNADDQMPHPMARIGLESSGSDGELMFANTRWKANSIWHLGLNAKMGYESETMVGRYIGRNQWFFPYVGFDYHYKQFNPDEKNIFGSDYKNLFGQVSNKEHRRTVVAGMAYTLPMLVIADARIDGDGKLRFQLGREDIPLSKRLRMNFMINTDKEYAAGLRYIVTKYFSLSSHYDSDMGLGAGLTVTY